jgi:hypothetical protein
MESRPEIGLDSYDRLFPSQDTMPTGGFGNLIALPFQARAASLGNTVFLDDQLKPFPDQWAYLSAVDRMKPAQVSVIVEEATRQGKMIGLRLPVTDENADDPWTAPPSRRNKDRHVAGPFPDTVSLVLGNQVYIEKDGLSPGLINKLVRTAAFQNPDFYSKQAMRKSTWDTPRVVGCAEDFPKHIGVPSPRGNRGDQSMDCSSGKGGASVRLNGTSGVQQVITARAVRLFGRRGG